MIGPVIRRAKMGIGEWERWPSIWNSHENGTEFDLSIRILSYYLKGYFDFKSVPS